MGIPQNIKDQKHLNNRPLTMKTITTLLLFLLIGGGVYGEYSWTFGEYSKYEYGYKCQGVEEDTKYKFIGHYCGTNEQQIINEWGRTTYRIEKVELFFTKKLNRKKAIWHNIGSVFNGRGITTVGGGWGKCIIEYKSDKITKETCLDFENNRDGNKTGKRITEYKHGMKVKWTFFDSQRTGGGFKKEVEYFKYGKSVKTITSDYVSKDGYKYKKQISKTLNDGSHKRTYLKFVFANGDKASKIIEKYKYGKDVFPKTYYNYYIKNINKTYDIVKRFKNEETCLYEYKHKGRVVETEQMLRFDCKPTKFKDGGKVGYITDKYEFNEIVKTTWFDVVYANGDKAKEIITEYKDKKAILPNTIHNYYLKKDNKTYDIVKMFENKEACLYEYKHKDKVIKTRPMGHCNIPSNQPRPFY